MMLRRLPLALAVLAVVLSTGASAQDCKAMYKQGGKPLLFGGMGEAGRCVGSSCQPRTTFWAKTCAFNSESGWGVCNEQQARNALDKVGRSLGGGEALRMTPCDLLPYLRGRTLWLLGDSHSKAMYKALQCFLIDFWGDANHGECETSTDASAVQQLFNLPERSGFQKCLHLRGPGGGRICFVEVVLGTSFVGNSKIAAGGVLPLLRQKFAQKQDIFFLNVGVWHKKREDWWAQLRPSLEAIGRDYQANRGNFPHMLFRETPAEHPKDPNGQTCAPMRGYNYRPESGTLDMAASRVNIQGWNSGLGGNAATNDILPKYGIHVIPAFAQSVPLHDNHIGTVMNPEQDCLHYCMPGVPQFWVWSLYDAMRSGKAGIRPVAPASIAQESGARSGAYPCVPNKIKF